MLSCELNHVFQADDFPTSNVKAIPGASPLEKKKVYPPIKPGWWYTYPSEKYEFVSWDDDIPNIWKSKSHVPNHQPDIISHYITTNIYKPNRLTW